MLQVVVFPAGGDLPQKARGVVAIIANLSGERYSCVASGLAMFTVERGENTDGRDECFTPLTQQGGLREIITGATTPPRPEPPLRASQAKPRLSFANPSDRPTSQNSHQRHHHSHNHPPTATTTSPQPPPTTTGRHSLAVSRRLKKTLLASPGPNFRLSRSRRIRLHRPLQYCVSHMGAERIT